MGERSCGGEVVVCEVTASVRLNEISHDVDRVTNWMQSNCIPTQRYDKDQLNPIITITQSQETCHLVEERCRRTTITAQRPTTTSTPTTSKQKQEKKTIAREARSRITKRRKPRRIRHIDILMTMLLKTLTIRESQTEIMSQEE